MSLFNFAAPNVIVFRKSESRVEESLGTSRRSFRHSRTSPSMAWNNLCLLFVKCCWAGMDAPHFFTVLMQKPAAQSISLSERNSTDAGVSPAALLPNVLYLPEANDGRRCSNQATRTVE